VFTSGFEAGTFAGFIGGGLAGDPSAVLPGAILVAPGEACFGWLEAAVVCAKPGVFIGTAAGTRCVPVVAGAA
jgi:hypothetical protein